MPFIIIFDLRSHVYCNLPTTNIDYSNSNFFPSVIVLPRLANATCRPVSLSCIFAVIYSGKVEVEVDLLLCCKMFDINF